MPNRVQESPFQEVGEGKRWEYRGETELSDLPVRPLRLTVLGLLMLAVAGELLWPTVLAVGALIFFFLLGIYNDIFREQALLAALALPLALAPVVLQVVMGIGLFRRAAWSRTGAMVALPITFALGCALHWSAQLLQGHTQARLSAGLPTPWLIHLAVLAPLTTMIFYLLARRETVEALAPEAVETETPE